MQGDRGPPRPTPHTPTLSAAIFIHSSKDLRSSPADRARGTVAAAAASRLVDGGARAGPPNRAPPTWPAKREARRLLRAR